MDSNNLQYGPCLYSIRETGFEMYQGWRYQIPVSIQLRSYSSIEAANESIQEAMIQYHLTHSNICKVYNCFLQSDPNGRFQTVTVLDPVQKNLLQDMRERAAAGRFWGEMELLYHLYCLTDALFYAEQAGLHHRDINPECIFIYENWLKLSNFTSAKMVNLIDSYNKTLVGTPLYRSPELRIKAKNEAQTGYPDTTPYDSAKCDVYALAATVLHMARLKPPFELGNLDEISFRTGQVIEEIKYFPTLASVLIRMLDPNPITRASALQVRDFIGPLVFGTDSGTGNDGEAGSGSVGNRLNSAEISNPPLPEEHLNAEVEDQCYLLKPDPSTGISCNVCRFPIENSTWATSVPSDLVRFQSVFSSFCSLKCMRIYQMSEGGSPDLPCARCTSRNSLQDVLTGIVVTLDCGHFFHDKMCFMKYLLETTLDDLCPKCNVPISSMFIDLVLDKENADWVKLEKLKKFCQGCTLNQAIKIFKGCNHRLCEECYRGKSVNPFLTIANLFSEPQCPLCKEFKQKH